MTAGTGPFEQMLAAIPLRQLVRSRGVGGRSQNARRAIVDFDVGPPLLRLHVAKIGRQSRDVFRREILQAVLYHLAHWPGGRATSVRMPFAEIGDNCRAG